MKTRSFFTFFAIAVVLWAAATPRVLAEDLGAVKQRMDQRVAAIDGMKQRGILGENNRGFLEARGALSGAESQTVSAENTDRSTVYAALARQAGSSADQVGRARAKYIAQHSAAGVWLQDEGGNWHRK